MNLLTRLSATITSKVDDAVAHIENHDAVVAVALKDTQAAVAKAKVRLSQLRRESDKLSERFQHCQQQSDIWQERAKQVAHEDEAKALECIARHNRYREQAKQTQTLLLRNEQVEAQIGENIRVMEAKLQTISQQQQSMRSRQSAADAMRVLQSISQESPDNLDATFDRWEMQITQTEYASGDTLHIKDNFEDAFVKDEERADLQAELHALLASSNLEKK